MTSPNSHVTSRPARKGEIGVALIFYVDPRKLAEFSRQKGAEQLRKIAYAAANEQFELGRHALVDALLQYVTEQQELIDATS